MSYRSAVCTLLVVLLLALVAAWLPVPHPAQARLSAAGETAFAAQDDLLDQVLAAGVLVVATDANYPPFSYVDDHGNLVGFDVDVAHWVAARLGVDLELVTPSWSEVTAGNWGGRWDLSIGSMTPTPQRGLVLWFTDPYYCIPARFAVHQDNTWAMSAQDLAGMAVGVQAPSFWQGYLAGTLDPKAYGIWIAYSAPSVTVSPYASSEEALSDLALGDGTRLDAALSSTVVIQQAIDAGLPLKFLDEPAFYETIVMALDQARGPSDEMIAALNQILVDMRADGTLHDISMLWLGTDVTSLPPGYPTNTIFLPLVAR